MKAKTEIYESTDYCPECNGMLINNLEKGEILCSNCGLVLQEKELDYSNFEKRMFSKQDQIAKARTGTPISTLLPDLSLCTVINKSDILNSDLKRAVKINSHLSWEKHNWLMAATELKRISSALSLPDHIKNATFKLYKKTFKTHLLKGRSIYGMISACVYYICKEYDVPRTLHDVMKETAVDFEKVKKCYKILINKLNLKTHGVNPVLLIPKFIADLHLNPDVEKKSIHALQTYLKNQPHTGVNPKGLCAGAIYLICKIKNLRINQRTIAKVVGVTEITLRSRYKEIVNGLSFDIS